MSNTFVPTPIPIHTHSAATAASPLPIPGPLQSSSASNFQSQPQQPQPSGTSSLPPPSAALNAAGASLPAMSNLSITPSPSTLAALSIASPAHAAVASSAHAAVASSVSVPLTLTPPTGIPFWSSRPVSECIFDLLHFEIVSYWSKQVSHTMRGEDPRLISKKIHSKLEGIGYHIGARYVERYSKDHTYHEASIDVVKYMCKEYWTLIYKKQIDKLQTNYKGIYVLHDFSFRWLSKMAPVNSAGEGVDAAAANATLIEQARVYTSLACGMIRGALANLGLNASVKCDCTKLPAVQFTIVEDRTQVQQTNANALAQTGAATKPTATTTTNPATGTNPRPNTSAPGGPPIPTTQPQQPTTKKIPAQPPRPSGGR